jgi:hypothetical protein
LGKAGLTVIADLVCSSTRLRSWRIALAYTAVAIGISLALIPDLLRPYAILGPDGHMRASLSRAVNLTLCRSPRLSQSFDLPAELTANPAAMFDPIREVVARGAGSVERYCASLRLSRVDNENSLMWLMRAALAIDPGISAAGLGATLAALRVFMLAALCAALSRAGASLPFVTATAVATSGVLRNLRIYQYHYVPFVLMLPLLFITVCLLCLQWNPRSRLAVTTAFAALGGLTAFGINMRTSQAPIYAGMFALFFLAWHRPAGASGPSRALGFAAVMLFAAGLVAVHSLIVTPLAIAGTEGLTHHMIMHPVVLGLAEPPSELSRRESIRWDDAVGEEIARRVDPEATYLNARYEVALLRYYVGLWRTHPREMLLVYGAKFQAAGSGVLEAAADLLQHRGLPRRCRSSRCGLEHLQADRGAAWVRTRAVEHRGWRRDSRVGANPVAVRRLIRQPAVAARPDHARDSDPAWG